MLTILNGILLKFIRWDGTAQTPIMEEESHASSLEIVTQHHEVIAHLSLFYDFIGLLVYVYIRLCGSEAVESFEKLIKLVSCCSNMILLYPASPALVFG